MMNLKNRKKFKDERGQAMVEFALVFPIFLVIVLFIVDASWVAMQRTAFDHGCMMSTWTITPGEIGYNDYAQEFETTANVGDALRVNIQKSNIWGLLPDNISISNARARCYSQKGSFNVPIGQGNSSDSDVLEASSENWYMDLSATIHYDIYPLTFVGSWFFSNRVTVEKQYEATTALQAEKRTG